MTYHSCDYRNDSPNLSEDIHQDSEEKDLSNSDSANSELISEDNPSVFNELDGDLEMVVANEGKVLEREEEEVGMVVEEGTAGKSGESVVVSGSSASVRNSEDRVEEPVREPSTSDSVSLTPSHET